MPKRQLISIVAAIVLAAHVGAGCCAHHEHAHDGTAVITLAAQHCHQHGHQHGHAAHHGGSDHSSPTHEHQPGDHHCGEGHCAFLVVSKVSVPELSADAALVTIDAATLLAQVAGPSAADAAPPDIGTAPPVRPHLLKQVLLI